MVKRAGNFLTLKDMIQGSGCTPRTVRYYEREGLLNATRSSGGHRLFRPSELSRLNFIISLREAGWSLDEITSLLSIRTRMSGGRDACRELSKEITSQIGRLQQKIEILNKLHSDLEETRRLLAICSECTDMNDEQICSGCDRLPAEQPTGFRLTWLAEGRTQATFDEPAAPAEVASAPAPAPAPIPASAPVSVSAPVSESVSAPEDC
ncbi:MAG TPA: MerR family transcriptional regulator [Nannocystis exedens]|nr:MerR family transcriptional regulator [Nannocystis exedens]